MNMGVGNMMGNMMMPCSDTSTSTSNSTGNSTGTGTSQPVLAPEHALAADMQRILGATAATTMPAGVTAEADQEAIQAAVRRVGGRAAILSAWEKFEQREHGARGAQIPAILECLFKD